MLNTRPIATATADKPLALLDLCKPGRGKSFPVTLGVLKLDVLKTASFCVLFIFILGAMRPTLILYRSGDVIVSVVGTR